MTPARPDIDEESLGAYVLAKVNMGPMYVGGQFGYSAGDDDSDPTQGQDRPGQHDGLDPRADLRERQPAILAVQRVPSRRRNGVDLHHRQDRT